MTANEIAALIILLAGLLGAGFYLGWSMHRLWGEAKCLHATHAESQRLLDALRVRTAELDNQ